MPICTIQAMALSKDKKQALVAKVTTAMKAAFLVDGEYQIFFNEYASGLIAHNGDMNATYVPIAGIECPAVSTGKKATLVAEIDRALTDAYDVTDAMIFLRHYPLENVSKGGKLLVDRRAEFPAETQTHA
jgi:phenylpyruvate tautomerase PptA (4-oxalocrotonate tautomerase family)